MANIKISELNELYGHQRSYDDYIPVVDSSTNETKKISVKSLIPNNVNIIAVTDTAPVEYETGDKYYNTDENKIYTATSWGWENPETPIGGILYVILAEQKTYTYDGDNETLVSVGSASGSVVNNYSTSTIEGYSCNYVNEAISGAIVSTYTNNQTSAYSTEYINDVLGYSSSEAFTGKYWINNKPIYRMVITITDTNATTNWRNYNYSDLGIPSGMEWARFPEAYTTIVQSGNTFWESFYSNGTRIQTSPADSKINILGNGASYASYVLVMEYTKSN